MAANEAKLRRASPERAPRAGPSKDSPRDARSKGRRSASRSQSTEQNGKRSGCWGDSGSTTGGGGTIAKATGSMWSKAQTADDFAAPNKDMLTFDALFKRAELAKAFSLDSSQVRKDAKRVKKRLHDANRFLLNPESRLMQLWDLTTVAALLFTLLVSPYEIGFLEDHEGDMPVLQIINILVNVTFGVDLFLNFFRPYRDALSQKVKSHARIAKNYLRSWFVIDLMSTVPFDLLATAMFPADEDGSSEVQTQFKLVRLMRLMKLFRIVRASRVFARWADRIEHYVSVSHSTRTLLWWMFMLLTTIHWFCCMWGLVAQIHGTQRTDALKAAVALDPACASVGCAAGDDSKSFQCADACLSSCELQVLAAMNGWSVEATLAQENWICRKLATGEFVREGPTAPPPAFVSYISVAAGFGQLTPLNTGEYCVAYFIAFVWLMMQNAFIGILCGTIADGDRHAKEYKQRMDELNYFLRDMDAPRELALRAREHCRSTRSLFKKMQYVRMFQMMSPLLRGDLAQQMSLRTLENVWYFTMCDAELLRALSERLEPLGFARGEKIYYAERINVVAKGAAARGGKILTLDNYWGDDMIVTSAALKDTRYASALTYVELMTVTRDSLEVCLINHPKSERVIRRCALKMAMQRAGQIIAHHLQTRMRAQQLSKTLARFNPGNAMLTAHASFDPSSESALRDMMVLINGGKVLRKYDDSKEQIVDETQTIIDEDYVRKVQQARRQDTDEALFNLREEGEKRYRRVKKKDRVTPAPWEESGGRDGPDLSA